MKYSGLLAFCAVLSLMASSATAAERSMVACISKSSGAVMVRARCRSSERKLSLAALQVTTQVGPKGEVGPQGLRGEKGERGDQGPVGVTGVKGDKGDRGEQGMQGVTGAVGPVGAAGPTGPQGLQGVQGPVGTQGPRGFSAFSTIPSGTTVFGAVGGDFHSATVNGEWGVTGSLLGIPPVSFGNTLVVVKNNTNVDNECGGATCLHSEELAYQQFCGGTVEAPSASPGWLCIYPTADVNASQVRAISVPNGEGAYGFTVKWISSAAGRTIFRGVWAYTAP